jgi:hypothetical protein
VLLRPIQADPRESRGEPALVLPCPEPHLDVQPGPMVGNAFIGAPVQ